jgi:Protein HRI1
MMNPDIGSVMAYEEIWREIPVEGNTVALLESVDEKDKTYVGRIGKCFQGIGTTDGKINAVRKVLKEGEWRTVFVVGDEADVPVFEATGWKVGHHIELNGRSWKVVDCQI